MGAVFLDVCPVSDCYNWEGSIYLLFPYAAVCVNGRQKDKMETGWKVFCVRLFYRAFPCYS